MRRSLVLSARGKPFSSIPSPPASEIDGHLSYFRKEGFQHYADSLRSLYKRYGPIVKVKYGKDAPWNAYLFDPEDAQRVLRSEMSMPHTLPLNELILNRRRQQGRSAGLTNENGSPWYRLRSPSQKFMMKSSYVQSFLPLMHQSAHLLAEYLKEANGEEVDMADVAERWALESGGLIAFGRSIGALNQHGTELALKIISSEKRLFEISAQMAFDPVDNALEKEFFETDDFLLSSIRQLVLDAKDRSFVSDLQLPQDCVEAMASTMFTDPVTTTAPSFIWILYNLAKHQISQEKVRDEVLRFPQDMTAEQLSQCYYLKAVIKESLRLFPLTTEISRILQKPQILSGYEVPQGTSTSIATYTLSRDLFQSGNDFMPERWLRGERVQKPHHPIAIMSGLLEKLHDAYDTAKTAVLGEKSTEQETAGEMKEEVGTTPEMTKDEKREKMGDLKEHDEGQKMEDMKEVGGDYMNQAQQKLYSAYDAAKDVLLGVEKSGEEMTQGKMTDMDAGKTCDQTMKEMKETTGDKMEPAKDCSRHHMDATGEKLHETGSRLQSSH
ncbi:hypothetical protein QR680_019302 [Steinernema hermaphroditum]|uniref:Cytochrome P450 n=1 Tax=Steinernema hermaphroditum TaxID=289476 RepID=A0AA39GN66_9BILA|nr:hypothetical protein QR680_019302 [Steinernema hermaphroditum]